MGKGQRNKRKRADLNQWRDELIQSTGVPQEMMTAAEKAGEQSIRKGANPDQAAGIAMEALAELLEQKNADSPGWLDATRPRFSGPWMALEDRDDE